MTSSTNAQGTTTYSYNALGERVKKSGPGGTVIFAYDEEGHLIGEYTSAGAMIQEIVWFDGLPVASLRPAAGGGIEIFNISSDHLGTPRVIRRATDGVVVWRWDSDPFGVASPNENPSGAGEFKFNLRFPGQYADAETGLNYNYFRDYNPKTGRYVQSDPIGLNGGLNTYSYVGSAPTQQTDELGLQAVRPPLLLPGYARPNNAIEAASWFDPVIVEVCRSWHCPSARTACGMNDVKTPNDFLPTAITPQDPPSGCTCLQIAYRNTLLLPWQLNEFNNWLDVADRTEAVRSNAEYVHRRLAQSVKPLPWWTRIPKVR